MRVLPWVGLVAGAAGLAGCASHDRVAAASAAPAGPGAVAGTIAADRNGDGVIDGWYSSDGIYHAFVAPPCPPPPPPMPSRRGERG